MNHFQGEKKWHKNNKFSQKHNSETLVVCSVRHLFQSLCALQYYSQAADYLIAFAHISRSKAWTLLFHSNFPPTQSLIEIHCSKIFGKFTAKQQWWNPITGDTHGCFPMKLSKTFRTAFLQNTSEQLLFKVICNVPFDFSTLKVH